MIEGKKTIIHIGMHKTATTLLQKKLISENSQCGSYGLRESKDQQSRQFQILEQLFSEEFDFNKVTHLIEQINNENPNTSIMALSNECISTAGYMQSPFGVRTGRSVDRRVIINRLSNIFPNATILLTIRNQSDYISSYYLQLLKEKLVQVSFEKWLQAELGRDKNIFKVCDYSDLLEAIEESSFESFEVLPYEWVKERPQKYFQSLSTLFDMPIELIEDSYKKNFENKRISNMSAYVNLIFPEKVKSPLKNLKGLQHIYKWLSSVSGGVQVKYSADNLSYIKSEYAESNKILQSRLDLPLDQLGYYT